MAHLFRLIVGLALALVAGVAGASLPQVTNWQTNNLTVTIAPSAELSCRAYVAYKASTQAASISWEYNSVQAVSAVVANCVVAIYNMPAHTLNAISSSNPDAAMAPSCPANSTLTNGSCYCTTPYIESGGVCKAPPPQCASKMGTTFTGAATQSFQGGTADAAPQAAVTAMGVVPPSCAGGCGTAPVGAPVLSTITVSSNGDQGSGGGAQRSWAGFVGGVWTVNFPQVVYTGGDCLESDSQLAQESNWSQQISSANAAPSPAPPGKCPGTVNGATVYVPCSAVATSSSSSSSSGPSSVSTGGAAGSTNGSGAGGSGGTNGNGSGSGTGLSVIGGAGSGASSSSQTVITVCSSTTCTTTTNSSSTASAPSGAASGAAGAGTGTQGCATAALSAASAAANTGVTCSNSTGTTQSIGDYCKANPTAVQCVGTQSSFGGDCTVGFTAKSDDAVINAMAQETFRQNCKVNPTDAETQLAAGERVKTGDQTGDNPNNSAFSLTSGSIDTSDALGGGGCISDRSITVFGGASVVLPFSKACDGFPMLGTLLVGLSFLVAGVIILRG